MLQKWDPSGLELDPINQLAGLATYAWTTSLREGLCAAARRARGSREDTA